MGNLSEFCCRNPECSDYGKKGLDNLGCHGYSGKDKKYRMLRCKTCGKSFSERKGTPFFGLHMSEERVLGIWRHLAEGDGIRKTHRLTGTCLDTMCRLAKRAGQHAKAIHEELLRHVEAQEAQFDEMCNFVGKKG